MSFLFGFFSLTLLLINFLATNISNEYFQRSTLFRFPHVIFNVIVIIITDHYEKKTRSNVFLSRLKMSSNSREDEAEKVSESLHSIEKNHLCTIDEI